MPTRPERDADEAAELDEDLDLPPPDADGEEEPRDDADAELPELEDEGLDDAESPDLDVGGDDLQTEDDEDDEPEAEIDVGPLDEDIDADDESQLAAEPEGAPDAEGIDVDEDDGDDDGGAEGTSEDPGDEVDEAALPELDDDDGTSDEDALAEVLLAEGDAELAPAGFALLEDAGARVPCRAVATGAGRVAAAGEVLLLVEEGARAARRLGVGEGSVAVALGDDALLAATARGQLLVMRHGGAEAAALGSWRAGVSSSLGLWPAESGTAPVELAATPGRFWIRAGAALLCSTSPDQPLAAVRERGVLAITASAGALVALTAGPAIERFRSDDEGWSITPLTGEAQRVAERDRGALRIAAAAGGRALALTDRERLVVSRDGGATFVAHTPGPVAAIAFAGERAEATLVALIAPIADVPAFLLAFPATGDPVRVCDLPADAAGALAWDAARELLWVASSAGLVAIGRPPRH